MKTHHLFISHSWSYGDQYDRLISLLRQRSYFAFNDYSVPKDDPIHNARSAAALRKAIRTQMASCDVVIVLAGVYASYSKWIDIEMDLAKSGFQTAKPILAIRPRGQSRVSAAVSSQADRIVNWNTGSIVSAIRELG